MKTPVTLVLLGTLWAVTAADASLKNSDDFFLRQLRSPFERKLKGTRRGCSAYGHSCFGGYGKRGGGGDSGGVLLPLPPDPDPELDSEPDPDTEGRQAREARSSPGDPPEGEATLFILRQSPVSSRIPLWAAARAYRGDPVADLGREEDTNSMGSRLLMRRWLRTYRQSGERGQTI